MSNEQYIPHVEPLRFTKFAEGKMRFSNFLSFLICTLFFINCQQSDTQKESNVTMNVEQRSFGKVDGDEVWLFTFENSSGMQVSIQTCIP